MDKQPSLLSDQNERGTCIFVGFQDKVKFQIIEDPYTDFLQSTREMNFLVFVDHEHIFSGHSEWPILFFLYLLKENVSVILVSSHLLDWLH